MTSFTPWLAPWLNGESIRNLGWALIHFLWEGLALALFLYVAVAFCRSARSRYMLSVCTLAAMVFAPIVTFIILRQRPQEPTPAAGVETVFHAIQALAPAVKGSASAIPEASSIDWLGWCVCMWLCGVVLFSLRALGGWLLLVHLRREQTAPLSADLVQKFRVLEQRLALKRRVQYLQSKVMDTPAVMGWFRPVVLVPVAVLSGLSSQQLEAVIVHELAHIKRLDCFINLFQIATETLLFYHPAVWWVNRLIRIERENCCDDVSVALCGNAREYARALTFLESARSTPAWALAATGGALRSRVMRLLKPQSSIRSLSFSGLGVVACILCAAGVLVAATTVSVTDWRSVSGDLAELQAEERPAPPATLASPAEPNAPNSTDLRKDPAPIAVSTSAAAPVQTVTAARVAQAEPAPKAEPVNEASSSGSYIDGMSAAGLKNLTIDELIDLKVQGVTPEYVRQVRASGFDPSVHDIIGMKVQGITPAYVKEIRATGLNPTLHDLVGMKVQGVTPSYVHAMQSAGLGEIKVHDIIGMKVQGVTPDYVHSLKSAGFGDLKAHDIIGAKVQGITPEYVEKVRSHGFKNLTLHQLIALKNAEIF
jgi:beta-lactamase regulating signal transducer with metallopeptidase domain